MTRRRIVFPVTGLVVAAVLTVAGACDRKHEPGSFSPTDPVVAVALKLSSAAASITANGSSTTDITAEITPAAAPGRRTVDFKTSTGPESIPADVVNVELLLLRRIFDHLGSDRQSPEPLSRASPAVTELVYTST